MNRIGFYRTIIAVSLFLLAAAGLPAGNLWSFTLGAAGTEYVYDGGTPELAMQEQAVGFDLRGSAIIKPLGMYYGTCLNVSVPMTLDVADMAAETVTRYEPGHDLFLSVGLPFGLRVPFGIKGYGIYAGVGPGVMVLADFDSHLWISGLMIVELGMEVIERRRIGAVFSVRAFVGIDSLLVDIRDPRNPSASAGPDPSGITLSVGISWAGNRN